MAIKLEGEGGLMSRPLLAELFLRLPKGSVMKISLTCYFATKWRAAALRCTEGAWFMH